MENTQDIYYTIASASKETLHKDRGSKFYGYAFPVSTEQDIKVCIENLKKHHLDTSILEICLENLLILQFFEQFYQ